jgi:tetratricopeptide (TPR) repeat protein
MALIAIVFAAAGYWVLGRDSEPMPPSEATPIAASEEEGDEEDTAGADAAADPTLAAIDEAIAAAERRAAQRDDDWLHLQIAANRYIDRARASGDWADFQKAEDALNRAFERAPEEGGPHLTLAAFEYAMHRLARATAALDATDEYAVPIPGQGPSIAQLRADIAFHSGRYEEARRGYEALLEESRTPSLLVALAQYHDKTGDQETATSLLEEAGEKARVESAGTRAWVSLVRGLFALERGAWDEALMHYRDGLEATPESWLHEEHIAEILTLRGEEALAVPIYERVIARTANPELMDALAGILKEQGETERAQQLVARAREGWERRLEMFPEAAYGHAIDHWLEIEEDFPRAVELAEANAESRPNGESKTILANAYLAAGRVDDAAGVVEEVLASPWDTADLHAVASEVYAAKGDEARARRERERALEMNPHAFD